MESSKAKRDLTLLAEKMIKANTDKEKVKLEALINETIFESLGLNKREQSLIERVAKVVAAPESFEEPEQLVS